MPAIIKTNSPAKTGARKYMNPVQRGLEYSFFGDFDDPAINFAAGKNDAQAVGAIARGADSISWRFQGDVDYLQTEMADTAAQTFIAVVRTFDTLVSDATKPTFLGTTFGVPSLQDTSSPTFGSRFYITTAGAIRWGAGRGTSTSNDVAATPAILHDADEYELYVVETNGQNKITSFTSGLSDTDGETAARFPTRNLFRIGSGFNGATTGHCDVAIVRGWSVNLTPEEITAEVNNVKAYMSGLGVTV